MVETLAYCMACDEMNAVSIIHDSDETDKKQAECDKCGSIVEIKFENGSVEEQTVMENNS